LSATFLARCLDASGVEIWSDVDGVLTAPPGLVPGARPLGELSYDDAAGLAQFGARVLHPDSLTPIVDSGIPVWVRNTLRPEVPGTRISGNPPDSARFGPPAVHAITAVTDASQLSATVHWGTHDLMSRTFAILERHGIHPLVLERRSTGRRLDLLVRRSEADRLERAFGKVPEAEGIRWDRHDGLTVVAAAGRGGPWIAGELARVLHVEGIAPSTISGMAGAPGICAVAVVPASQGGRAVRALHAAVVEHVEGGARPGCLAGRRSRFATPSGSLQEALAV
jgi:aspartokinase/homoserine dehydrogenase 1